MSVTQQEYDEAVRDRKTYRDGYLRLTEEVKELEKQLADAQQVIEQARRMDSLLVGLAERVVSRATVSAEDREGAGQ